jgi:hypothetical protein
MKSKILLGLAIATIVAVTSCTQDDQIPPQRGDITFLFKAENTDGSTGGRANDQNTTPRFASYSLRKSDNSLVSEKIELFEFNGDFISTPQQMQLGHYALVQFLILNETNQILYASPTATSPLAYLVEHPLPMEFDITANDITNLAPEVLAMADHTPEEFGYAKFGFDFVRVGGIQLPAAPGTESWTKVSFHFSNPNTTISSEISVPNSIDFIILDELLDQTWHTTITLWTQNECTNYQKMYRFKGTLTFTGSIIRLQMTEENNPWVSYYYKERGGVKILRSTDPRTAFKVELQLPEGTHGYGFVDRTFWTPEGDQLCETKYEELNDNGTGIINASFSDQMCGLDESAYTIDSFIVLNLSTNNTVEDLFEWEITNKIISARQCIN